MDDTIVDSGRVMGEASLERSVIKMMTKHHFIPGVKIIDMVFIGQPHDTIFLETHQHILIN